MRSRRDGAILLFVFRKNSLPHRFTDYGTKPVSHKARAYNSRYCELRSKKLKRIVGRWRGFHVLYNTVNALSRGVIELTQLYTGLTLSHLARPGPRGVRRPSRPLLRARLHLVVVVGGAERVNAPARLKPRRGPSAPPQRRGKQRRLGVERCRMSNLGRLQHTYGTAAAVLTAEACLGSAQGARTESRASQATGIASRGATKAALSTCHAAESSGHLHSGSSS